MTPHLNLSIFSELQSFSKEIVLPENAFDLMGVKLEGWLDGLLKNKIGEESLILGDVSPQATIEGLVFIGKNTVVEAGAYIKGPTYIGENSTIRHSAYIRGHVFVGNHCIVGHCTEAKHAVFLDHSKAGHFAYVGNSILGNNTNLGAGTKLANLKLNHQEIKYLDPTTNKIVASNLKKFGAIIGDHSQTGCNSVLSPGTLLLPKTFILPCVHFHGTLKSGIAK